MLLWHAFEGEGNNQSVNFVLCFPLLFLRSSSFLGHVGQTVKAIMYLCLHCLGIAIVRSNGPCSMDRVEESDVGRGQLLDIIMIVKESTQLY